MHACSTLFEGIMILCFGAAWPLSIIKSIHSRSTQGKSGLFLCVVFVGYIAGCIHKYKYNMDPVIWLYVLNAIMVSIDIGLYVRNRRYEKQLATKNVAMEQPT